MYLYDIYDYYEHQEAANEYECRKAAKIDGFTIEEADNCENGNLNCSKCPWK